MDMAVILELVSMSVENDIVLIHINDEPATFARIEEIRPDVKKDWFIIKLLMLQLPLKPVSWILKSDYINGVPFYMSGQKMQMEKVVCPVDEDLQKINEQESVPDKDRKSGQEGVVVSFSQYQQPQKTD